MFCSLQTKLQLILIFISFASTLKWNPCFQSLKLLWLPSHQRRPGVTFRRFCCEPSKQQQWQTCLTCHSQCVWYWWGPAWPQSRRSPSHRQAPEPASSLSLSLICYQIRFLLRLNHSRWLSLSQYSHFISETAHQVHLVPERNHIGLPTAPTASAAFTDCQPWCVFLCVWAKNMQHTSRQKSEGSVRDSPLVGQTLLMSFQIWLNCKYPTHSLFITLNYWNVALRWTDDSSRSEHCVCPSVWIGSEGPLQPWVQGEAGFKMDGRVGPWVQFLTGQQNKHPHSLFREVNGAAESPVLIGASE